MAERDLVLDIETQNTFEDAGEFKPQNLRVSCVGVYFYKSDSYRAYMEEEMDELEAELGQASLVVGFNHLRFDLPVLEPYFRSLRIKNLRCLDILESIRRVAGHRVSLNSVAQATLNAKKSGHGLQAIKDWQEFESEQEKKFTDFCQFRKQYWQEVLTARNEGKPVFLSWKSHCENHHKPHFTDFSSLKNLASWKKLERYCLDDVKITKEVFEFGRDKHEVFFTAKDPRYKSRVPVDWKPAPTSQSKQMGLF